MRLLVTRPEPDAERTAAALRARGHTVIVAPLLHIEVVADAEIGAGPWAAILVTSANAAAAIARHERFAELRALPVFAVGERSAQAMRAAGFADVTSADGDVSRSRAAGRRAHETVARRFSILPARTAPAISPAALSAHGFAVRTVVVYRAVAARCRFRRRRPRPWQAASTACCTSRAAAPRPT